MKHRMAIAVLALAGFFVSLYLWLWKVGLLGTIACGDGGCETVQLSEHAEFLGPLVDALDARHDDGAIHVTPL